MLHHVPRHKDISVHGCLWSLLRQSACLSSVSSPPGVWTSWCFAHPKCHPHTVWAKSPKDFLLFGAGDVHLLSSRWFVHPVLHHSLMLQASSPLSKHTTAIPQTHVMLFTMPLICGEPVVSLLFPTVPCRATWLFPGCKVWCHFCLQSHFRVPRFFCLVLLFWQPSVKLSLHWMISFACHRLNLGLPAPRYEYLQDTGPLGKGDGDQKKLGEVGFIFTARIEERNYICQSWSGFFLQPLLYTNAGMCWDLCWYTTTLLC